VGLPTEVSTIHANSAEQALSLAVAEREAAHDSAAHLEGMEISVLAGVRRLNAREITVRPLQYIEGTSADRHGGRRAGWRFRRRGEISWRMPELVLAVLDRHEVRRVTLVVAIPDQAGRLRARRGRGVCPQVVGEMLLQPFDRGRREAGDPPEHVDAAG
jgi:hypothetical protein